MTTLKIRKTPALLLLLASTSIAAADWQTNVIAHCTQLVHDYAYYRDRFDADGYSNLFTEDGELVFPDNKSFKGRETLRNRIHAGSGKEVSHHHMSTIKIFPIDESHATGVSYLYILQSPASEAEGPLTAEKFAAAEYHDRFLRSDDGWKFQRREIKIIFQPAHQ